MLKFLAANMGLTETELQPALQLANTPQRPSFGIGLGWWVVGSEKVHFHGGNSPGYTTFLEWDPERKIGAVVLMNVANGPIGIVLRLIRGLPITPVPVDPQVLAAYAGRYQASDDGIFTIRVDGARIFMQPPFGGEYELIASSETQFYPRDLVAEITFFKNDSGKVDRMVYVESGVTVEAKKVP
jgi:CubicO group peptidase (beta-lactamase class C family)